MSRSYTEIHDIYTAKGWTKPLPLPARAKFPPPTGFTGHQGRSITDADRAAWASHTGNIALHLVNGIVGFDVDAGYGDKHGDEQMQELEARLGELPPTYMSTRRGDPLTSSIRFYRYSGRHLRGSIAKDIEAIQKGHRYAVVWPSEVPTEDNSLATYRWYHPDGTLMDEGEVPGYHDLPELPKAWDDHFAKDNGIARPRGVKASSATTSEFEREMIKDARPMCVEVRAKLNEALERFADRPGARYDTMRDETLKVVSVCAAGHPGYAEAIEELRLAYVQSVGDDREPEFERFAEGAVAKAAGERGETYTPQEGQGHMCETFARALEAKPAVTTTEQESVITTATDTGAAQEPLGFDLDTGLEGEQAEQGGDDVDWTQKLDLDSKTHMPAKTIRNLDMIMANDSELQRVGVSVMGRVMAWRGELPSWRYDSPELRNLSTLVDDTDLVHMRDRIRMYLGGTVGAVSTEACDGAITKHAGKQQFSPWRDYLDNLPEWDGIERVKRAVPTAADTEYTERVCTAWLLGMMERAYDPGCQMDLMLILQGKQGVRKTSWLKALVPDDGFYTGLTTVPDATSRGKDAMRMAHRSAVVAIDEMDHMRSRDETSRLKEFITGRVDEWRDPYGRKETVSRRSFVLAGTTNERQFLRDTTGNRRFAVLEVLEAIKEEHLERGWMDQLLSEARDRYLAGERAEYGSDFETMLAEAQVAHVDDPVGDAINAWLDHPVVPVGCRIPGVTPGQRVLTDTISVRKLVTFVPELLNVDLKRDSITTQKIGNAMDAHPDYHRVESASGRTRVDGHQTRNAWAHNDPGARKRQQGTSQEIAPGVLDAIAPLPVGVQPYGAHTAPAYNHSQAPVPGHSRGMTLPEVMGLNDASHRFAGAPTI